MPRRQQLVVHLHRRHQQRRLQLRRRLQHEAAQRVHRQIGKLLAAVCLGGQHEACQRQLEAGQGVAQAGAYDLQPHQHLQRFVAGVRADHGQGWTLLAEAQPLCGVEVAVVAMAWQQAGRGDYGQRPSL